MCTEPDTPHSKTAGNFYESVSVDPSGGVIAKKNVCFEISGRFKVKNKVKIRMESAVVPNVHSRFQRNRHKQVRNRFI